VAARLAARPSCAKAALLNNQSITTLDGSNPPIEDTRRGQLVEVTIDSLAELGYVGTTLAQIATRAGVSPGLVAHYFGDKDGLLDAAFRSLARRVGNQVRTRLRLVATPRGRIQAIIDANLAPEEFEQRTGTAWLAFWGQVLQVKSLKRVQSAYQKRMLSNLRTSLKKLVPADEAQSLAAMIAAMIDGVWLRAALSGWREADSESARALLTAFVDGRLKDAAPAAADIPVADSFASGNGPQPAPASASRARTSAVAAGERFASINPATGEVLGYVTAAGSAQVNAAVFAARRGQVGWAAMTGAERARVLRRAADILRSRNRELAELETRDTGKPIQETLVVDVVSGADCFEYFAGLAQSLSGEHIDLGNQAFGYTRREPLGVVAGIGAWNYPLQIACWKSAPALACGNAMIFKPAELTPFTAVKLEEILLEAGLPPGVFQVVQGFAETGRLLTRHGDIRKVSLTGEVGTGKAVMSDAAQTLKSVTLELGGKSPLIIFEDAKLDNAVAGALLANFYSSGQVCSNGTRVFVHRSIKAAFLERLVKRVNAMRIGDPAKVVAFAIPGIADDVELSCGRLQNKARPQRLVAVVQSARRPVPRRHQGHREFIAEFDTVVPVERLGLDGGISAAHGDVVAKRRDDARRELCLQFRQRRKVEMIVMSVRHQHDVDFGQCLECDAGIVVSFRPGEGKRRGALRPHGIDQDIQA